MLVRGVLAAGSWCPPASAQAAPPAQPTPPAAPAPQTCPRCDNPQSPRVLAGYTQNPTFSIAPVAGSSDAVKYTRRSDRHTFLLKRCGQHYHCHIENVQPACGQQWMPGECGKPAPDDWVEVHTVLSTAPVVEDCDPERLTCCKSKNEGDPVLVLAYHAKVTKKGPPLNPVPVPWGFASAQWS